MYHYFKSNKLLEHVLKVLLAAVGLVHLETGLVVYAYRGRVWDYAGEVLESYFGSLAESVALVALVCYLAAAVLLVSAPVSGRLYRGVGKLLS
jgi:hypothetical protein